MASDYEDILNRSWGEVPKEKLLPKGSYLLKGQSAKFKAGDGDTNPYVLIVTSPVEAMDDVNEEEFAELGADYDVKGNRIFTRVYLERGADYDALKTILTKFGVDTSDKASLGDSLKEVRGKEVVGFIGSRTFEVRGETRTENTVSQWAAVE